VLCDGTANEATTKGSLPAFDRSSPLGYRYSRSALLPVASGGVAPLAELAPGAAQPDLRGAVVGSRFAVGGVETGGTGRVVVATESADRLSDPARADTARDLIRSVLHTTEDHHADSQVDVALDSVAAERLATTLGDDFPMAIVWDRDGPGCATRLTSAFRLVP
jgi:hypothetical protein